MKIIKNNKYIIISSIVFMLMFGLGIYSIYSINKFSEKKLILELEEIKKSESEIIESRLSKDISHFNKYTSTKARLMYVEELVKIYIANGEKDKAINLILENMEVLKTIDYKYNTDDILEFIKRIVIPLDPNLAIQIIEESEQKYLNLSDDIYLKILNTARQVYLLTNNYARASEVSVRTIKLAHKLGYEYEEAKSMVELGVLFKKIKGEETAIDVIEESLDIEIDNGVKNADVKVYALLNLCELYLSMEDYQQAEIFSGQICSYKKFFLEEDYRDIEILKYNIDAQICIYKNELNQAKEYLEKSLSLQEIDSNEYYYEKDIPYNLAMGKLHEAEKKYDKAKSIYKEILSKAENEKNYYLYEKVIKRLSNIEEDVNLKNEYLNQLILLTEYEQDKRYGDYTLNLLYRIEYEKKLSEEYSFKILVYEGLLIALILMIIFKKQIIKLVRRNSYDVLTDSYNRRVFNKVYNGLLKRKKKFTLAIMDIDNFKKLNDTYGHQFGDKVLIDVCQLIKSKIDKNYKLYRYGGEEFIIIARKEKFEDVIEKLEYIRESIELMIWEYDIKVTVSMGVSSSECRKDVLEDADKKLYISKNTGKNKITYE